MHTVYLGLGSNLGDRQSNLTEALRRLGERMKIEQSSSIYETAPVGYPDQPDFLNMVCCTKTDLAPFDLLAFAKEIEGQMGRQSSFRNAPRPIDIDILFFEDRVMQGEDLVIPHPRIAERAFVLVPLVEIAPLLIHPVKRKNMENLLSEIADSQQVRRWGNVPNIGSAAL